jgi:predicted DNA-binding transcriptional regulator YafY
MIPLEKQKEFDFRANQIKIDVTPWLYAGNLSDTIELIKIALEQHQILQFDYRDIRNRISHREMEPYRLLLKGEDWYVQGYCLRRDDFRTFKLLRMKKVCILEKTFQIREFPFEQMDSPQFNDKNLVPAKLRIHEAVKDTIITRFGEDCLTLDGTDYYIADVRLPIDDLACSYLLSLGNHVVCLEPEALKEKMRKVTEQIYEYYH